MAPAAVVGPVTQKKNGERNKYKMKRQRKISMQRNVLLLPQRDCRQMNWKRITEQTERIQQRMIDKSKKVKKRERERQIDL